MIDKIKQAMRMWKAANTHGDIREVTGLSYEQELAATEIASKYNLSAEHIYMRLDYLKDRMTWAEIEAVMTRGIE